MGTVNKAGDHLSGLFRQYFDEETLKEARKTAGLFGSWDEITQLAKINAASDHSRIRDFEKGVLVIEVEHPGWIQLLQTKQKIILNILQKKYPDMKIQGISFYLSKTPLRAQHSAASSTNAAVASPAAVASHSEAVDDKAEPPDSSPPEPRIITEENKAMHESFQKFKKVIEKRNRRNQHK